MTDKQSTSDTRLIERWLPIAELGEESVRERRSMTALPPIYYLHVWWARRPLVASRAAILASLLPGDADRSKFMHMLGIHGEPLTTKRKIQAAKRTGEDLGADPYGYPRAYNYLPTQADHEWLKSQLASTTNAPRSILDPTAGGGSIPLEMIRLGQATFGNDINPVAVMLLRATVEYPIKFGNKLVEEYQRLADAFLKNAAPKYEGVYPPEPQGTQILGYIWARTVRCPYCEGLVPLSPNWRLSPDGTGVRLLPCTSKEPAKRRCAFELVQSATEQSLGTTANGDATCPFPDCQRVIEGDEMKRQAQLGQMGEQLFALSFKRRILVKGKNGKSREKWERGFRCATPADDNCEAVRAKLASKHAEWDALDVLPNEPIPEGNKTNEPIRYGCKFWRDMFSQRQLLSHGFGVETFNELIQTERLKGDFSELTKAAFVFIAIAIDNMLNYGNRSCRWDSVTQRVRSIFDRHDFAFYTSYAEMALMATGAGYQWSFDKTGKCIKELLDLVLPASARHQGIGELSLHDSNNWQPPPISITCKSGDALDYLADGSIDAVVLDPPYYDNVMYAELSDFFYVWLKRTAGQILPDLFRRQLTDKENEAVANAAKFKDQKSSKARAGRDYQERMAAIFAECRRVLKPDGIMTLMFTHKATGAWDALTKGLMHAGFTITASWPINTESESSLHIKDKAAANSTIFLACRPRAVLPTDAETQYWEDVEPLVASAVRKRVAEFQVAGIRGVDLYLASFGPALEEFSKHWPLKRGTPNPLPPSLKRAQKDLFPEEWDPYAVSPEDALDAARREVKRWRLEQLTHKRTRSELDARTSWFVLAWDAFEAPVFPYDEALRLARAVGVDLDKDIVGSLAEKKGSDMIIWDSVQRANKSALGSADGSSGMIDALHHAAYQGRTKTLEAARELLERAGVIGDASFRSAMQAILEVLPIGNAFSGVDLPTDATGAGSDFEALEKLRRLAFADQVEPPEQLKLVLLPRLVEGTVDSTLPIPDKR